VLFWALALINVLAITVYVASYGVYVLKQEQNRRGAAVVFITAAATVMAPLGLMWYYAHFM